jgi:hypothetical protein
MTKPETKAATRWHVAGIRNLGDSIGTKIRQSGGGAKAATNCGRETPHRLGLFGLMLLGLFFFLRDSADVIKQLRVGSSRPFGAGRIHEAQSQRLRHLWSALKCG